MGNFQRCKISRFYKLAFRKKFKNFNFRDFGILAVRLYWLITCAGSK